MSIIKSYSVGDGDMFYINHDSDNFTVIDCCYANEEKRDANFSEIREIAESKGVCRFISTHPDNDHILGLENLFNTYFFLNFYCVYNRITKMDETDDFKMYRKLRDDKRTFHVYKDCSRKWMNESSNERGGAGIHFYWPDINDDDFKDALEKADDGVQDNNISPIFTYSLEDGVIAMWMGDMEEDFTEVIKEKINWSKVDILFAPHHGRKSGRVPSDVLEKIDPEVIVIGEAPSKDLEYYSGYNTITQNSAGDIVFDCMNGYVHVFVSNNGYTEDFLTNKYEDDRNDSFYIGSFKTRKVK